MTLLALRIEQDGFEARQEPQPIRYDLRRADDRGERYIPK